MKPEDTKKMQLTHLDEAGNPRMVDVGDKAVTRRMAHARSVMLLGEDILRQLSQTGDVQQQEIYTKKGPVFQTAIIAGTMAVKKTSELIPFCHPLPVDACSFQIHVNDRREVVIDCIVQVTARTGVEMEALTGASVAALTVYDMCKALSHDIIIQHTQLMEKTGGKQDYKRENKSAP